MINCAHPTHFEGALADGGAVERRIRGLRANASTLSHAELDEAEDLDDGDPADLARAARRAARVAAEPHDPRWLLRHRHPPRHEHLRRLDQRVAARYSQSAINPA